LRNYICNDFVIEKLLKLDNIIEAFMELKDSHYDRKIFDENIFLSYGSFHAVSG